MPGRLLFAILLVTLSIPLAADQIGVAVASNFTPTLRRLAADFHQQSGHELRISSASTGKLYAQIAHGAPFDLFLAADVDRPKRLETTGMVVPGSRFTYASGRLVLWGPGVVSALPLPPRELLQASVAEHIAIANPKTAPYGAAAKATLQSLSLWEGLQGRLVRGENVAQAYQYVVSGGAKLGFVALAQVLAHPRQDAYLWHVPQARYPPIRQQAVLLLPGDKKPAARQFLTYLRSTPARRIIEESGYLMETLSD